MTCARVTPGGDDVATTRTPARPAPVPASSTIPSIRPRASSAGKGIDWDSGAGAEAATGVAGCRAPHAVASSAAHAAPSPRGRTQLPDGGTQALRPMVPLTKVTLAEQLASFSSRRWSLHSNFSMHTRKQ